MIDILVVRGNPDLVRASQRARGADESLVDQVLAADAVRRSSITEFESLRSQQKTVSKSVGAAMGKLKAAQKAGSAEVDVLAKEADDARAQAADLAAEVKRREAAAAQQDKDFTALIRELDNIIIEGVPSGGEDDFETLETVGAPREFDFEPLDHLELGEKLGAIDMGRGAKVSGARFYYLKGAGARLSNALMAYAQSIAFEEGFTPLVVPTLVTPETMGGTGYLDAHEDVYHLESADLYLTGTSEVALAGFHAGEIIDLSDGPLRYTATSTCYRREAGSYGKDTRGIFRVHQFTKTEMFIYCDPDQAVAEHQNLLRIERRLLDGLELPYRVIDVAAGDLGGSAARKFDCEAWMPTQQKYRELTSTSNCTTYQSRRLNIRQRTASGKTDFVATLNGTMLTDTRPIVALLENHQQADGSIRVPVALQPFLGADVIRPA